MTLDGPSEVLLDGHHAGYAALRECDSGEWAWGWERPDRICESGICADPDAAIDHLALAVKGYYDRAH